MNLLLLGYLGGLLAGVVWPTRDTEHRVFRALWVSIWLILHLACHA